MNRSKRLLEKSALELIEESVHLLRRTPLSILALYYLGTLPFVLGLLFFWGEMSRDPFAPRQLAGASLGVAALFLWMKAWQTIFARQLWASASGRSYEKFSFGQLRRIFTVQAVLQSSGLFLLPLALLIFLPLGWAYAFYQNLTALHTGDASGCGTLVKKALKLSALWPRQNHIAIAVLFGFAVFVFLNWCVVGFVLPSLAKTLFGYETMVSRNAFSLMNTTYFAVMGGLTYLCVDPLVKAMYMLRCFYGESRDSGEDLKAELKSFRSIVVNISAKAALILLSLFCFHDPQILAQSVGGAASADNQNFPPGENPAELNKKIGDVLEQRKYTWRMPREKIEEVENEQGVIGRFLTRVRKMIGQWLRSIREWLVEWIRKLFGPRSLGPQGASSGLSWMTGLKIFLYSLVAAALAALAWLVYRTIRDRRKTQTVASVPIQALPDLADENVAADQLPEDGWSKLGRELLARGELRLALRAFYLASLAHLATRNLINLARFKSNRDYLLELGRRGHSFPELLSLFSDNVAVFDRTWYGMHEITEDLVTQFMSRVERLRGQPPILKGPAA